MAITRACIDRFRSNLAQSFSTWQPIRWFKVKGSKVKVTVYVTANTDSRQICVVFLLIFRVSAWSFRPPRVARGGRRLRVAVAIGTSQNVRKQYFQTKQTWNTQNVWRDVVRPSRCNAFAIACFLVCFVLSLFSFSDVWFVWQTKLI